MHGILDTSMGWVCNGVTGSSAFAAYDAGFDVRTVSPSRCASYPSWSEFDQMLLSPTPLLLPPGMPAT